MDKMYLKLPLIVNGEEYDSIETIKLNYDEVEIEIPKVTKDIREKLLNTENTLHDLTVNEIVTFLQKVSKLWIDENYPLRKKLLTVAPKITGQSIQMYVHNIGLVLSLISFKTYMEDMVESEMGDKRLLDEWVSKYDAEIHAEPLGKVLHIISGNVPLVGIYSIIRGLLTKNVNIVKLAKRDILTAYLFVKSFKDVDPDHPVTKTVSALYWDHNDNENIEQFAHNVDCLCVWGSLETINAYKFYCKSGCEFIEYGPKRGMQIIDYTRNKDYELPLKCARDICLFDQEACLSPQIIFIKGDVDTFIDKLEKGLKDYCKLWPKPVYPIDHYLQKNYLIKTHEFAGNDTYKDPELDWLIIKLNNDIINSIEHPLGRTIYIKEINNFDECMNYIDNTVQTIGIEPKELAREIRDKITIKGVSRIANIGYIEAPRHGLVHEGIHLSRLVKIVGMDKETKYKYKVYDVPENYFGQFTFALKWDK